MKKLVLITLLTLTFITSKAQTAISAAGTAPDASAMLDVIASDKGMLIPRVALTTNSTTAAPVASPVNGLLIFNTATVGDVTPGFYYWYASAWVRIHNGSTNLSGAGTTNYLARWTPNGNTLGIGTSYDNGTNLGIGTTNPLGKLHVSTAVPTGLGALPANSVGIIENGAANNYITFRNTADNGTYQGLQFQDNNVGGYIAFRNYVGSGANDGTNGDYMVYGTYTDHIFQTGASEAVNGKTEVVRMKQDGKVGIGTATPSYKLQVQKTTAGIALMIGGSGGGPRIQTYGLDADANAWMGLGTDMGGNPYEHSIYFSKGTSNNGRLTIGDYDGTTYNTRVTVLQNGNVGIASTAPGEKLDVAGNIKASGVAYWGNSGTRSETRDDAGLMGGRSGFYETSAPAPAANWYTGASGWQHLLETRHSNTGNNFAMQIAGSFFDQDFWVRKTNNSATTAWAKMLTTANISTNAIQNQYSSAQTASFWVNGNAQIGSSFTNLNGRLLTSNQGGWQADGVTPQMVISANSASTNRAALIGLNLHNDNTTNNAYAPFITFSRRSNGTAYNSAFASIGAQVTGQGTDANWCAGDLIFSTENGVMNGMGERMRIDRSGRVYILQNQGGDPNFTGLEDPTSAEGRAQLVLSSSYSDLVIASSQGNDNHGSTISMVTYNPGNAANYRKWVINQGNWGARSQFLDFGYGTDITNPHSAINSGNTALTVDGTNRSVGIGGAITPNGKLDVTMGNSDGIVMYQPTDDNMAIQGYLNGQWSNRTTYAGGCCNKLLLQPDIGEVGIRTTGPTATLDVNGSMRIRSLGAGMVKSDGSGNLSIAGGGDVPAGSNNYIQNQWGGNQSANFHISGSGRAGADFRAPIFYDENNTAFFVDPNSNALLNKLRVDQNATTTGQWGHDPYGYGWGAPAGSFRNLEVSSSGNYSTEPAMFRIHQWGSGAAEFWKPQGTNLYLRETPGGGGGWFTRFIVQGKYLVHRGSIPNGWDQADWGSTVSFRSPGTNVMANASHGNSQLELVSDGAGTAHIAFHRPGLYGANFGLDSDNWFSTQGWSAGGGYTSMRVGSLYAEGKGRFRRGGYGMGSGNEGQIEVNNAGNGEAFISFHREGAYGAHFGLGGDNWFSTYGWSAGGGWTAMRVGAFQARGGGAFYSSAYTRDWGDASGATYGSVYCNADNQFSGGIALSDDGGFYDRNDGWIRFDGSVGIVMDGNNASSISFWDMNDNGGIHDKQLVPSNGGWGLVGTGGNYWYYMYAGNYYYGSRRDLKRDITPIDGSIAELVLNDLDKLKPSFYKLKLDMDEWVEGQETKYRPNYHLGLILDETPDYIQDQTFGGLDLASVATLGVLGAKLNRQEIKEIKEAIGISLNTRNIQDFGSATFTGKEFFVAFNREFSEKLGNAVPMVTVTSYNPDITLSLKEKSSKGFTIISSTTVNNPVAFDYIAMAKIPTANTSNAEITQQISPELMSGLKVDQSAKDKIHQYWDKNKQYYDDLREGRLDNTVLPVSPQK